MIELLHAPIARRACAEWSMGLSAAPASKLLPLSNASWTRDAGRDPQDPALSHGEALLHRFWNVHARAR